MSQAFDLERGVSRGVMGLATSRLRDSTNNMVNVRLKCDFKSGPVSCEQQSSCPFCLQGREGGGDLEEKDKS